MDLGFFYFVTVSASFRRRGGDSYLALLQRTVGGASIFLGFIFWGIMSAVKIAADVWMMIGWFTIHKINAHGMSGCPRCACDSVFPVRLSFLSMCTAIFTYCVFPKKNSFESPSPLPV